MSKVKTNPVDDRTETKTKKSTKKKTTKSENTEIASKAMLIDEAKKLIKAETINAGASYNFVKRKGQLVFIHSKFLTSTDVTIMGLKGTKIIKGLEEHHWDIYGDALVLHFQPKQLPKPKTEDEK